jgi:phage terminase large subunit
MPSTSRAIRYANEIDWRNPLPAYERIAKARLQNLKRLSDSPGGLESLLAYYFDGHWAEFICDWGTTFDPRHLDVRLQYTPFILTPRQIEYVNWVYQRHILQQRGVCKKHRDAGMSWLNCAIAVLIWLARPNSVITLSSQKQEKVDNGDGDSKSLFWKVRKFLSLLPKPMQPAGWREASKKFLVVNPANGASISGEIGDQIGRGDRALIAFPDEFAELEHPQLVESGLAATAECVIYGSTQAQAGHVGTLFWELEHRFPEEQVFVFEWWQDPRKRQNPELPPEQEEWYKKKEAELSPAVFKSQYLMLDDSSNAVQFVSSDLIVDAFKRHSDEVVQHPKLAWRIGVDAAGQGNDKIKIWCRRGRINQPAITLEKLDGRQLSMVLQDVVNKLLAEAPVELICIEKDGPGQDCATHLKYSPLGQITVGVHTGARLGDGANYNLRSWLHKQAKDYLTEEAPVIPYSKTFLNQATAIHYTYKNGLLLIESKEQYRARFAAGTSSAERLATKSPDEWDSFMLSFAPPSGRPLTSLAPKFKALRVNHQKNAYALA